MVLTRGRGDWRSGRALLGGPRALLASVGVSVGGLVGLSWVSPCTRLCSWAR